VALVRTRRGVTFGKKAKDQERAVPTVVERRYISRTGLSSVRITEKLIHVCVELQGDYGLRSVVGSQ
jgi:hypothetical protein